MYQYKTKVDSERARLRLLTEGLIVPLRLWILSIAYLQIPISILVDLT